MCSQIRLAACGVGWVVLNPVALYLFFKGGVSSVGIICRERKPIGAALCIFCIWCYALSFASKRGGLVTRCGWYKRLIVGSSIEIA